MFAKFCWRYRLDMGFQRYMITANSMINSVNKALGNVGSKIGGAISGIQSGFNNIQSGFSNTVSEYTRNNTESIKKANSKAQERYNSVWKTEENSKYVVGKGDNDISQNGTSDSGKGRKGSDNTTAIKNSDRENNNNINVEKTIEKGKQLEKEEKTTSKENKETKTSKETVREDLMQK